MSHLNLVNPESAQGELKDLYAAVAQTFGAVPNFIKAMGNSPALLGGFLGLYGGLSKGGIDAATAERIALAMSEANSCAYCVAAHTALAQGAGVSPDEVTAARRGTSSDSRAAAAVQFARSVLDNKGQVTAGEIDAVRKAGYNDAQIAEIIGHVGLNTLLNYFGKATRIDIDFPRAPALAQAA
ncbi:MAG: peroxidase [Burkholderiales bacterium PBB5]|nr:MAG: peroxidase [Burkholderiales bacterium PBB5]